MSGTSSLSPSNLQTVPLEASPSPSHSPQALPYRSWVEVSLPQIAANFHAIQNVVGPGIEVMPVVKADAYRHGAVEVSRTLEREGARWLAVSNTDEGVALRDAGVTARILVMADFLPFTREATVAHGLTPVIHSLEGIAEFNRLAELRGQQCRYHLKIDSGLGRLGVRSDPAPIVEAILSARHVRLEGLMTHLASAANYGTSQTDDQLRNFNALVEALDRAGIHAPLVHLSSTNPIAYARRQAWRTMIRPGHSIYGYVSPALGPAPASVLQVKPALSWRATILSVKEFPAGCLIGYGGMFRTARPTRTAVLAAGYADGIPHRLGNRGSVIFNGKLAPIIGAVSMDLTTVDITDSPNAKVGDPVTLLGSEGTVSIDAQQIAKWAGTISYSVLCGIHARVRRVYV